ncbi:MAG: hypothetical protein COT85_03605 [Chlamydiae bacterium CG10_big_fil_rev_8_21_14_0_10_42_34]|nr:MAG: hypothetical protein COT85_03605 [Chlamydiae bacterium CG10_big_fil_rev_8_21_14_0_10_42_34]
MKHVVLLKSRAGNYGGLEKYASRIANAFHERGAKVSILTTGKTLQSEFPIYSTKTFSWPAFIRMEQFDHFTKNWIEKNQVDLVFGMDRNRFQTHIRAGNGVHAAFLKSRLLTEGKAKVFLCKMNPLHRKILELEKAAFENPLLKKLFTNSHMVKKQILEHYNTDPNKVQVIHNGVEWEEMHDDFNNWEDGKKLALQEFGLNPEHFQFLFIGSGYLRKGLDRLLGGLSQLKQKDFHLSVIGKDNNVDLYRAKAVQLGLKDHVTFFGASEKTRLFYQLADSLIIPSFYDPFANVTVEALAMGLFVISSKLNGGYEVITPENGTVIEDLLSTDAMVNALEIAMNHKKTPLSSSSVRNSIKYLDFSNQMRTLMDSCG